MLRKLRQTVLVSGNCLRIAGVLWVMLLVNSLSAQLTFSSRPADVAANCNFVPRQPTLTATTTCAGGATVLPNELRTAGACPNTYVLTRTWTAKDGCGNVATYTQTITVSDTQAPIIAGVPANVTVPAGAIPGAPNASAVDFCDASPTLTVVRDSIPGACGGYSLVRLYTARDACGNTRTRQYVITVNDDSPPVILGVTAGGNLSCGANLPAVPNVTATDNASVPLLSMRMDTLTDLGGDTCKVIRRIWTATDNCGLQATAVQRFVLIDGRGPVLTGVPANATIYCTSLPTAPALYTTVIATDPCDPNPTIRYEERSEQTASGACTDVNYRVLRIWTAIDACGNETVRTQILLMKCECCGNGIDDDDDGLTDDYDPQCNCFAGVEAACDSMKRYYIPPVLQTIERQYNSPSQLVVTTLAPEARFHITTADGSTYNQNFVVRKGAPLVIDLTVDQLQSRNHDRVERNRGWVITSDQLIQPIFRIDAFYSKDIATIKGPQALGRVFRAASQTNTCDPNVMANGEGHFISVMATEDNTEVTIHMTFPGLNGLNGIITRRLNRHETYLIRDDQRNTTVSGSLITSTKPIAVISGSQHTRACRIDGSKRLAPGQDAGFDQLVPNCLTGTEYVMVRGKNDPVQQYAILIANKNDTRVLVDGDIASEIVLQAGEYRQVFLTGGDYEPRHFAGNKPFYAYQVAGISNNNEVGMAICAPVGACKGDTLIEFPKFSGNSGGKLVDNSVYVILPQQGLASLRINGAPYTSCATTRSVPARPDLRVVVFENGCLADNNSITSDERFTAGILVGIDGNTGLHGYLTSFKDRMEVREPRSGRVVTAYLVDTVCGRSSYSHCINVASCATEHRIAAVYPTHGTVTLDGGSCLTYHSPERFQGIDEVLVTIQNDQGLFQTVCLSFFVCASPPDVLFNFLDTVVSCDRVPPMLPPVMSDECGMRIQFESEDVRQAGECEYSYIINRNWIFWDDCDDSTRVTQIIRVRDTMPPQAINIPSDTIIAACSGIPPVPVVTFVENCDNNYQYTFTESTTDSLCVYDRTIVRTWEAWDECGNRSTAVQRIQLRDTSAPVLTPVPSLVLLGCGQTSSLPYVSAADDCDPNPRVVIDSVVLATSCDTLRHVIRRWTATDACGRSSTISQRIVVVDASAPLVRDVPRDTIIACGQPLPTAVPTFSDDCTLPVPVYVVDSIAVAACPVIERIYRRWTAVDACGHVTSATQLIEVVDTMGPRFLPLPDTIFSSCLDSVVVLQPTVLDDCGYLLTFSDSMASGPGCNGERLLYRHYVVRDACGRGSDYTQLYYFRDIVPPVWLQEPVNVVLDCDDPIPPVIDPRFADACSGLNPVAVVIRDSSIVCPATRWVIRNYTISDWCGNLSYFTHRITINGCEPVYPVLATGQAGCTGEDIILKVTVDSGYLTPIYHWQYSPDGITWTSVGQPVDSSTLTLPNADPNQDGFYRVNVANNIADLGSVNCSTLSNNIPITVRPPVATTWNVELCRGDTLHYLGEALTSSVSRIDTLRTWYGCDSVATLHLNVFPYIQLNLDTTLCFGESLELLGVTYTLPGIYRDTLVTTYGCDTSLVLTLRVLNNLRDTSTTVLCAGESFLFEGQTISTAGIYSASLTSSLGCDSSRTVLVSVRDVIALALDSTICAGGRVRVGSEDFSVSGTYRRVLEASSGCDSTVSLRLTVVEPTTTVLEGHVCAGEQYYFGELRLERAGIYTRVLQSVHGCDSTVQLNLRVAPRYDTELRAELCEGEIYRNGSYQITLPGRWPLRFNTADGCDSVVNVTLVYRRHRTSQVSATICLGDSYNLLDTVLTTPGTFVKTGQTSYGCDSTVTLVLRVEQPQRTRVADTLCFGESLRAAGRTFTTSTKDSFLLRSAQGCDSLVVVDLEVRAQNRVDTTAAICFGESLNLYGRSFSTAGVHSVTIPDRNGCDSTWAMTLSVFPELRDTVRRTICAGDVLTYGNQRFSSAGHYSFRYNSANGCDSIIILDLELRDTTRTDLAEEICEGSSRWFGGQALSEPGRYIDTLQNAVGCDSIVVLRLSVRPRFAVLLDTTLCLGEKLVFGGKTLSEPGRYVDSLTSLYGCDSVVTLRLDYYPTAAGHDTIHLCEGVGIDLDGSYITKAGEYASSWLSAAGCDSTHTVRVFVHTNRTLYDTAYICHDGYFVFAGDTLRQAGNYVAEFSTRYGCDSTIVLELLVTEEVRLAVDGARICAGSTVQLNARGYSGPIHWTPSRGLSCTDCPNPQANPMETTRYIVSARDCSGQTVTAEALVTVMQPVDVKIVSARKLRLGESTTLKAVANDPDARIRWREGNQLLCEACDEIEVRPLVTTIYEVEATNGSGCDDTERLTLIVEDECSFADIEIPNILTPNGDGANDLFEIRYAGIESIVLLRVYNRWGEVVYQTRDINVFWDGTHRGQPVNPGVFVYYIEGYCLNHEKFTEEGNVTVVR